MSVYVCECARVCVRVCSNVCVSDNERKVKKSSVTSRFNKASTLLHDYVNWIH